MNYFKDYDSNEIALGFLRVFAGGALLIKGIDFMINMHGLYDLTAQTLPFSNFMISHYIVGAHVIGGFFLMIGLLTRISALVNIPVILGAILFVHAGEGLFSSTQGLELTVMLLVVLSALSISKIRFLSVDTLLSEKTKDTDDRASYRKFSRQNRHRFS